jgi:hypothetical protein
MLITVRESIFSAGAGVIGDYDFAALIPKAPELSEDLKLR